MILSDNLREFSLLRKETKTLFYLEKIGFVSAERRVGVVWKNGQDEGWAGREEVIERAEEKSDLTREGGPFRAVNYIRRIFFSLLIIIDM